ncbi:hypothetical protein EVAR_95940_1 [Eumeta japonica]|uniref:Uncharacterized protein n=1 Tax=Eumeta variegata TaxID=151549 RepID=A0A4C1V8K5_EUMVA|nr:hypothetical protein EVAR_95940_1 [Eumeta japonica]
MFYPLNSVQPVLCSKRPSPPFCSRDSRTQLPRGAAAGVPARPSPIRPYDDLIDLNARDESNRFGNDFFPNAPASSHCRVGVSKDSRSTGDSFPARRLSFINGPVKR